MTLSPTVELARDLIQRPSVTPLDGGCQAILAHRLDACGFECEHMPFQDVSNLWATRGDASPLLVFAGLTDDAQVDFPVAALKLIYDFPGTPLGGAFLIAGD